MVLPRLERRCGAINYNPEIIRRYVEDRHSEVAQRPLSIEHETQADCSRSY